MSVYKRGQIYWYKFRFDGQMVRESAKTNSKTVASEAERARHRQLELSFNGLVKRDRLLLEVAAMDWLATKTHLVPKSCSDYRRFITKLSRFFGKRLIKDITAQDVAGLQQKRLSEGYSARSINYEVGILRSILRYYGKGEGISARTKNLRERIDVGRALDRDEESRLLKEIRLSRSAALYPFFVLSLDAGLRPSETRALRRSNLSLNWLDSTIVGGEIIVASSKTAAGAGRMIPLTLRACAALTVWLQRFPRASDNSFVFPFHRVASGKIYDLHLDRPMSPSSYVCSFRTARRKAAVALRFYDARHTFVTRLAENSGVSEETIRQLAGHVDQRMLGRYSHIRVQARRDAIATLESQSEDPISSIEKK